MNNENIIYHVYPDEEIYAEAECPSPYSSRRPSVVSKTVTFDCNLNNENMIYHVYPEEEVYAEAECPPPYSNRRPSLVSQTVTMEVLYWLITFIYPWSDCDSRYLLVGSFAENKAPDDLFVPNWKWNDTKLQMTLS